MLASTVNVIMGVVFIVGLFATYIPQYHKICKKKSSHGLSNSYMILGNAATFLSSANSLIYYINGSQQQSQQSQSPMGSVWIQGWRHTPTIGSEKFLGLGIIILQWVLFMTNYVMYVWFHPHVHQPNPFEKRELRVKRNVIWGFVISNMLLVILLGITLGFLSHYGWHYDENGDTYLAIWSVFLEVLTTTFFLLHYVPQIWETYQLKDVGSISLISLGIMCPGSYVWTVFLACQSYVTGNPDASKPQVWVPYLIVATMQLVLLIMGMYYERRKRPFQYLVHSVDESEAAVVW